MGRARQSGRAGVGGFLRLGHPGTDCYIFGAGEVGGKGPVAEAVTMVREEREWACDQGCRVDNRGAKKESERLVSGIGGDLVPPRAGPLSVHSVASSCPVYGIGDVQTPRGLDPLSHHKLGLDVRVDFRLPNGVLEVEAQACGLAGATSTPTAAAVTTASFAARGPVVRPPGVPPCLPAQALLLQQELEAFHFATCGAVLCLSKTVSRGFAHSDLALALEQGCGGGGCQLFTGGSFGGEVGGW